MEKYNERETKLLDLFFTNLDSNIYCVKDNMPQEVWATFMGSYSRTHLHMRDNFLDKIRKGLEESLKAEHKAVPEDPLSILPLEMLGQKDEVNMDYLMKVAGKFLGTWAIAYGHGSLKDSATFRAAVEDVSIIATKEIESARLAAFQETSTRYMDFSKQRYYIDNKIQNRPHLMDMLNKTLEFYVQAKNELENYVRKNTPAPTSNNPKEQKKLTVAWLKACEAKAFDNARYILPAAMLTKLGITCSAREAEYSIAKYLSSPLREMRDIGAALLTEGQKILPTLLSHASENEYMIKYWMENDYLAKLMLDNIQPDCMPKVSLASYPKDLEERLVASILYTQSRLPFEQIIKLAKTYTNEQKKIVFAKTLNERGAHDRMPREFEEGELVWDILIDYGAYRDVQRHRIGTQLKQLLTTQLGFETPKLIKDAGLEDKYGQVMRNADIAYKDFARSYPYEAQYIVPLAFRIRDRVIFNPRQTAYFIELRSGVNGHESYRSLALMMHKIMKQVAPNFAEHIRACYDNVDLGRLKEEIKAQNKMADESRY
ncbi:MAG: FAD-dependent thymidylate synthase [Candidatus Woesearchaeota archaeon]